MGAGSELSKTVATFIVQKILLDECGLNYICTTAERFYAVASVLSNIINQIEKKPTIRLLKHTIKCYARLSDNARAREALKQCIPKSIKNGHFIVIMQDDPTTVRWLTHLKNSFGEDQADEEETQDNSVDQNSDNTSEK